MKTIKKNWLKGLIISVSLLLINCSVEEEVISGSHFGPQNKKFTFQDFKKETKIKDFDIFSKYNVSRSENGVMQKSIQQDFITDTTSINRFEIPNIEKTTYSFKLYPLSEQLNSKEYYNMVVEKYGNQLTYMVFLNKDKQNPAPNELRTQTSQMVFNSRSPHPGFSEVITYHFHCTQTGSCASGVCDQCSLCVSETVSYLYIGQGGSSGGSSGSGSGGSGTGGNGSGGGGGGGSPLDGFYIPNPYDGMDMNDPSNSALALSFQINTFFNTLSPELKEIAKKYVNFAFACQYFNINGFDDATKQHYLNALSNYKNFIDSFSNSQITTDGQAKLEYWAFQTFLNNNENGINNIKINNVKNFLNNPNVDFLTKEKIIDELATKNNQEVLDFISELSNLSNVYNNNNVTNNNINEILKNLIENYNEYKDINYLNQVINDIKNDSNNNNLWNNNLVILDNLQTGISDINDYLSVFDLLQGALFTLYVDQPTVNSKDSWSGSPLDPNVGHTFISIKQGNKTRVLGFYPSGGVNPMTSPSTTKMFINDSSHSFDVSISVNINSNQLSQIILSIKTAPNTYNLNTYNCTDFGMTIADKAGIKLPSAHGTWPGGSGDNPGQLGQNIRNLPNTTGVTVNELGGTAPNNSN